MIDYHEIHERDLSRYWQGTVVFRKTDGAPFRVDLIDSDGVRLVAISDRPAAASVSTDTFFNEYIVHRPSLGWRNVKIGALYATQMAGRSMQKALLMDEIRVVSPFYEAVRQVAVHLSYTDERQMNGLVQFSRDHSYLEARSNHYLRYGSPDYFDRDSAYEAMASGSRVGAAISPMWALIADTQGYAANPSIYYGAKRVGRMTDGRPNLPDELTDAWSRLA